MNAQPLTGSAPEIRPFNPEATIINRAITILESSSVLLERLHQQDDPRTMLDIVVDQLRKTVVELEGLLHE